MGPSQLPEELPGKQTAPNGQHRIFIFMGSYGVGPTEQG